MLNPGHISCCSWCATDMSHEKQLDPGEASVCASCRNLETWNMLRAWKDSRTVQLLVGTSDHFGNLGGWGHIVQLWGLLMHVHGRLDAVADPRRPHSARPRAVAVLQLQQMLGRTACMYACMITWPGRTVCYLHTGRLPRRCGPRRAAPDASLVQRPRSRCSWIWHS